MLTPEIEGRIRSLERRAETLLSSDDDHEVSIEEHGKVLNDARDFYLRQIQAASGPVVENPLAPFPSKLKYRLEELILWLEAAYDGGHEDEHDLMKQGSLRLDPNLKDQARMWRIDIDDTARRVQALRSTLGSPRI